MSVIRFQLCLHCEMAKAFNDCGIYFEFPGIHINTCAFVLSMILNLNVFTFSDFLFKIINHLILSATSMLTNDLQCIFSIQFSIQDLWRLAVVHHDTKYIHL